MTILICTRSYPGVGKSTIVEKIRKNIKDYVIIETDAIAQRLVKKHGLPIEKSDWGADDWWKLHNTAQQMAIGYLQAGNNVIYDATNLSQQSIDDMQAITEHDNAILMWADVPLPDFDEWLSRLSKRPEGATYWFKVIIKMSDGAIKERKLGPALAEKILTYLDVSDE